VTGAGIVAAVVALGCAAGFVVAVVRADERVHATDPAALSSFVGAPRRWGLAAGVAVVLAVVLLVDAVVTGR
jgi:hypothetical protein